MNKELKSILLGGLAVLTPMVLLTLTLYLSNPYLKMASFCLWCVTSVVILLWVIGRGKAYKMRNDEIYNNAFKRVTNE